MTTILSHANSWLAIVKRSRSIATYKTYVTAFKAFGQMLYASRINPGKADVSILSEKHVAQFIEHLNRSSVSTEKVYLTAVRRFYRYLNSEGVTHFNMDRIDEIIADRGRKVSVRYPEFPAEKVREVIKRITKIPLSPTLSIRLQELRDIALILTLADTGLRNFEALTKLRRADVEKDEITIIGKGNKQGVVYWTPKSKAAVLRYLRERAKLDGATGKPLASLPLFSRHDKAGGGRILPLSTVSGRNIIAKRVNQVLGDTAIPSAGEKKITPHTFRHYFVTSILNETDNIKLAQELARHSAITTTGRYAHLTNDQKRQSHQRVFAKEGKHGK